MVDAQARRKVGTAPVAERPLPNLAGLNDAPGFLLSLAQRYAFRAFDQDVGQFGFTPRLYSILMLIDENPGCRLVDIGETLGMLQTNLVKRIDALVDKGLVERGPDPQDRRSKTLRLTAEGVQFSRRLRKRHDRMIQMLRDRVGPKDYDQLIGLLRRFVAVEGAVGPLGPEVGEG